MSRTLALIAALGPVCRIPAAELTQRVEAAVAAYAAPQDWLNVGSFAQQRAHWLKIAKAANTLRTLLYEPLLLDARGTDAAKAVLGAMLADDAGAVEFMGELESVLARIDSTASRVENGHTVQAFKERQFGRRDVVTRKFVGDMAVLYSAATGEPPRFTRDPITDDWRSRFADFCITSLAGNMRELPTPGALYQVHHANQLGQSAETGFSPSCTSGANLHSFPVTDNDEVTRDQATDGRHD